MKYYFLALGITLITEVPIVAALFPGRRVRMGLVCAVATTATHVALHFDFPPLLPARVPALLFGEAFATLAEAAAYVAVSRDVGRSLVASAIANTTSFCAGLILFT